MSRLMLAYYNQMIHLLVTNAKKIMVAADFYSGFFARRCKAGKIICFFIRIPPELF
jgi:hypothetical protein